ncbi:hypothetical protein caldi_20660 [Caldinitratiruptor microaerophilus]|uniref:Uncharacterized protein n=2 Tax=Caldinitratiruptor microaerophilus TaxID=671077 RepID=A0AA35G6A6_9FIRM|nr:hypothetical protein caldi_20660 [Caldinitratiruptor microaerophilus]
MAVMAVLFAIGLTWVAWGAWCLIWGTRLAADRVPRLRARVDWGRVAGRDFLGPIGWRVLGAIWCGGGVGIAAAALLGGLGQAAAG